MTKKRHPNSPIENMSKRGSAPSQTAPSKFETSLDKLVKIELITINDKPYFGQATDDELLYIWVNVFNRSKDELYGVFSTKSLTRNVRATFRLNKPTKLHEIYKSEVFTYEKFLEDNKTEIISGRIIGFNSKKAVELGQKVNIQVRTNFGVEVEGVVNWIKLYGLVHNADFIKNPETGLMTEIVRVEVVLKEHVPEYLPMYGQKCQVMYPGIPRLCNNCYTFDHYRRDCNNRSRDWIEYVIQLTKDQRISHEYIGTWKRAIQRWENANAEKAQNPDDTL